MNVNVEGLEAELVATTIELERLNQEVRDAEERRDKVDRRWRVLKDLNRFAAMYAAGTTSD